VEIKKRWKTMLQKELNFGETKIHKELNAREIELIQIIRPSTFQDIVAEVRKDIEKSRFNEKKEIRNLKYGNKNGIITMTEKEQITGLSMEI
jgi:hypothetical protein